MRVITFAATKGGTGKTTLALAIGLEAARHGSVYFVDLDPQRSLTELLRRRDPRIDEKVRHQMTLLKPDTTIKETIRLLATAGKERDYMVIDTPGSHMSIIKDAVGASNVVILPVQPSPLDLLAQEDVARVIDEMGMQNNTLFAVNRLDARTLIGEQAFERVMKLIPNTPIRIAQRVDYPRAAIAGRSAPEINRDAAEEIAKLWRAIQTVAMKGMTHGGRNGSQVNGSLDAHSEQGAS